MRLKQKYGNYYENLTRLELLKSLQIAKCDLICKNYCILLKISKELSCKNFLRFLDKLLVPMFFRRYL
ncbi:hypothetical protein AR546_13485 [Leptospira interrogans serovar Canicola]|nr:hypothetical protein AMR47_09715 [Leptospira interrogans]OLZ30913.1 hypothetical protein AR546_13485 [Leptospira interrogans serovar Canicola]OMH67163.1 hypothetical protein BW243_07975 [Leptospira interrogans serovar Pomona]POR18857.1 hypothetical protein B0T34_07675 [Leptospira interrogans serovar Canicola]